MKERCENCQHFWMCARSDCTTKVREDLNRMEEKILEHGVSGTINFHCNYFRRKEVKE